MRPTVVVLQAGLLGPETLPLLLVAAGLGLGIAEALAPGAHFIVVGIALTLAGLVGFLVPALAGPLALGALVLVFVVVALVAYREFDLYGGSESGRTSDSASLRGRTGRVTERVTPTEGEVRLADGGFNPVYAARSTGGEIPVGTEVVVVDPGGGNVLTVESLGGEDAIDRELRRERERRAADERSDGDPERTAERETETE
jgi:membrane protein implicated in regulation of membrane protease activity